MSELIITAGARPNFMKIAPLLWEGASRQLPFALRLVHTGQHYDAGMSDVFFQQLDIPAPDVQLGVGSGTHGQQTARALEAFEGLFDRSTDTSRRCSSGWRHKLHSRLQSGCCETWHSRRSRRSGIAFA